MDNSSPVDMPVLSPSAPVNLPTAPSSIGLGEMGFIAIAAVWLLQTVLKQGLNHRFGQGAGQTTSKR